MDQQNLVPIYKQRLIQAGSIFLVIVSVFFVIKTINEIKTNRYIGGDVYPQTTIAVSGEGEVFAVPDVATLSFSVQSESLSVAEAQENVTQKIDSVLEALDDFGVEEKDIKTTSYNVYPRYEYRRETITCVTFPCPQPPNKRVLVGYDINQTVSVKIRDTEKAGQILGALGEIGVSNISGLSFSIEDEEELIREARKNAIEDAQKKARELSKDLGVKLVRIVNFNESGGGIPMRLYAEDAAFDGKGGGGAIEVPQIPEGENRIVSRVNIVYEIR